MEELQNLTRKAFATTYGFLLMSQCYHWNVEGPDFLQYHDLFGRIYTEVDQKIDVFAEQIRTIRAWTPATLKELSELSSIEESTEQHPKDEMVRQLYLSNGKVNTDLIAAYNQAEVIQEHGLANFISERMDQHRKHGWMLYSSMKVA
jgi:starvation-inducible DNA-binding protein